MKVGYILITNKKYLPLTEISLNSILEFSNIPVILFTINFEYIARSERIHVRRVDLKNEDFQSICYFKIQSIIESGLDMGILLDADMILTKSADDIFMQYSAKLHKYPLFPLHPQSPIPDGNLLNSKAANYFRVMKQSQPYVHAGPCLFNANTMPFFQECSNMIEEVKNNGISVYSYDEGIINLNLWRNNVSSNYMSVIAPPYKFFESKIGMTQDNIKLHLPNDDKYQYLVCHGCKDVNRASNILNFVRSKGGLPL